ncbi:MAG: GNAT family N-acetyltransferase, partial [Bacteroidota bacterium]
CYPEIYPLPVVRYFTDYHSEESILKNAFEGTMLVAEKEGEIVGTGFITNEYIGGMYIQPEMQGIGIGKIILNKLLNIARSNNVTHLELDATLNTREFYEKFGFYLVAEETQMLDDGTKLDYYRMGIDLKI